jgi:hypothetical protein
MATHGAVRAWLPRVVLGLAAVLVLTSILPLALRWYLFQLPFMWRTFTNEAWAEAGCKGLNDTTCANKATSCPRGSMANSLIRNYLIVGKTSKADVLQSLGPPDSPDRPDGCSHYTLGMCSGFGFDYDVLYVCFDEQERLIARGHRQG